MLQLASQQTVLEDSPTKGGQQLPASVANGSGDRLEGSSLEITAGSSLRQGVQWLGLYPRD